MAALSEMQFDLDGLIFGDGRPVFIDKNGFDPGDSENLTQDGINPRTGARMFGEDQLGAPTWTFAMHVDREDTAGALETLAQMGALWRHRKWRQRDAVASLRYRVGGRTRVVFGRPRRFSYKPDNLILGGYIPPLATFDLTDHRHYDEVESFLDLRLVPSVAGGFEVPFTAPVIVELAAGSATPGQMTVGGDVETSPTIEFVGPVTDPVVTIGPLVVGLQGTVPAGATITVDARPWSMGMFRTGPFADVTLSRGTRLTKALLDPGAYSAVFKGNDLTGGARCRVRWRNAHTTL